MSSMSPFKLESNIYVCLTRVQYVPVLHIFDVSMLPKSAKGSDAESTKDAEVC